MRTIEALEGRTLLTAVTGLSLVDTGTGRDVGPLVDGMTVELPAGGLAVEARVDGSTSSVGFFVGLSRTIENKAPYVTGGDGDDRRPDRDPRLSQPGRYRVAAVPFPRDNAQGTAGRTVSVTFTVTAAAPEPEPEPEPEPQPQPSDVFNLFTVGDIGTRSGNADRDVYRLLDRLTEGMPDSAWEFAGLGDFDYDDEDYGDDLRYYFGAGFDDPRVMRNTSAVLGNHEKDGSDGRRAASLLGIPSNNYTRPLGADWVGLFVNSEATINTNWVRDRLREASAAGKNTALFTHRPRYSGGDHGDSSRMAALWNVGRDNGLDLYAAGHDHDAQVILRDGVFEVVSGIGGTPLRDTGRTTGTLYAADDYHGLAWIQLMDDGFKLHFIDTGGAIRYERTQPVR